MNLHQWDIVRARIRSSDKDEHPAILISREEWCQDARRPMLNVLYCSTMRPADHAALGEVVLNGADGLDRRTLANAEYVFGLARERIGPVIGRVCPERRRQIGRAIVTALRLPL